LDKLGLVPSAIAPCPSACMVMPARRAVAAPRLRLAPAQIGGAPQRTADPPGG
jgi:hypothetical protein